MEITLSKNAVETLIEKVGGKYKNCTRSHQ